MASVTNEFVYVVPRSIGPVTMPASLLMLRMIPGPSDGIMPSGRNWVLSVARVEMYVALVTSALLTKLGGRLRAGHPPVDVIVITAAKDAETVRVAMQGGALHYLLKPFGFPVLRDKLLSYAQMRTRLGALRDADQRNVDRVFGALRPPDQLSAAKGHSVHTLEAVEQLLSQTTDDLSAAEVAERTGMSRATAQRYLSHLHELGRVEIRLRYGSGGRPEHGYRWRATGLRRAEISRMTAARIT